MYLQNKLKGLSKSTGYSASASFPLAFETHGELRLV